MERTVGHAVPEVSERGKLSGVVERVTFHYEDSGFCVLRVKARGQRDLITVVDVVRANHSEPQRVRR